MSGFYQEDEVARLVTNMVQWGGDGVPVRCSMSALSRILRDTRVGSAPIVTLGVDAGHALTAMKAIGEVLAESLLTYHTSSLTLVMQAEALGIARTTHARRLELGHVDFMREYLAAKRGDAK